MKKGDGDGHNSFKKRGDWDGWCWSCKSLHETSMHGDGKVEVQGEGESDGNGDW